MLLQLIAPLSLGSAMLGIGLGLRLGDFVLAVKQTRAFIVGISCQLFCLPILAFTVTFLIPLEPKYAVGLVLLSACPGGPSSNFFTLLARGNVALSVLMTGVSSLATVITLPLVIGLAMGHFGLEDVQASVNSRNVVMQLIGLVLAPMCAGMTVNHLSSRAVTMQRWVLRIAVLLLAMLIGGLMYREFANVISHGWQIIAAAGLLLFLGMSTGALVSRILKVEKKSARAIVIEVGMQNAATAIVLAVSPAGFNDPEVAIPALAYGLLMYIPCVGFALYGASTSVPHSNR